MTAVLSVPTSSEGQASAQILDSAVVLFHRDLQARALRLTRNEERAADLVQDTIERALRFRHKFQQGSHPRAWLYVIMQNVFISQMRRRGIERRVMEGARVDPNGWASRATSNTHAPLLGPTERALDSLPERLQEVVRLVDLCDYSYREAAEVQEVPVGTIMSRLHRGRSRLSAELSRELAA